MALWWAGGAEYKRTSPWTIRRLLRTKQVWQIAIGYGIILLITVGVLSTFVTTLSIKAVTVRRGNYFSHFRSHHGAHVLL